MYLLPPPLNQTLAGKLQQPTNFAGNLHTFADKIVISRFAQTASTWGRPCRSLDRSIENALQESRYSEQHVHRHRRHRR
jgi:hypothetical protein